MVSPVGQLATGQETVVMAPESTGLGLALVRELARAHGGDARLEAHEGGGAAVVVASLAMGVLVPKMSRSRLDELDAEAGEPEQPWGETTEPATASGSAGRVGPGGGR